MVNTAGYRINEMTLVAERYDGQDPLEIDITNIMIELNLFETIYLPYIAGSIVIADTATVGSVMNFQGQEKLRFTLIVEDEEHNIRNFVVHNIARQSKNLADTSSIYVLDIIEEHAYLSYFKRIRTAYSGNISEIIANLFQNELGVEVDTEESDQRVKVLGCNRTPIGMAMWLKDRATSDVGEPMFLYSTIKEGLKFRSLGSLLSDRPLEEVFRYTQIVNPGNDSEIIQSMIIENNNDMVEVAKEGALKSTYISIDPFSGTINHTDFNAPEYHEEKSELGRTLYDHTLFDENFSIGGEKISELPSTYVSQINTSRMFSNEIKSYDEDPIGRQVFKVRRKSDLVLLNRERIDIMIDGYHMLAHPEHTSVGTVIEIKTPKDQPSTQEQSEEALVDKKRSGLFLITDVRHIFNVDGDYSASLSLARIGTPDDINDPNRSEPIPR